VCYDPCGGLQIQTRRLTKALNQSGASQTVLTTRLPNSPRTECMSARTRVQSLGPRLPGWLVPWMLGVTWGLAVMAYLWRHRRRDTLVHIHFNHWLWCRLLVIGARILGMPTVVTFSTQLWVARKIPAIRRAARWIDGISLRRSTRVIALTQTQARHLDDAYSITPALVCVIPDAIDADAFRASADTDDISAFRTRYAIPRDRKIALYLGRIRAEKGWHDLPEIARALAPDGFLLICGDGPDRAKLAAAMRLSAAEANWNITGFVDQTDARLALGVADVLILPSRREAFGSVMLEAMACGVPAVAYRVGGLTEVSGSPPAIRLVEPGDKTAMIDAVRQILDDPMAHAQLTRRGLARVRHFALSDAISATMAVYRAIETDAPAAPRSVPELQKKKAY